MKQQPLRFDQKRLDIVRERIRAATIERPVTIRELRSAIGSHVSDRWIKGAIETLRRSGVMIGSSREAPMGYWTPRTESEEDQALKAYLAQARRSLQTARMMMKHSRRAQAKGAGQLVMDFIEKGLEA